MPTCARTLLIHYPLGRPLRSKCTSGHFFGSYGSYTGYPWFLGDSTQRILALLKPSLVLSGDMHESCYYEHPFTDIEYSSATGGAGVVPEWTATSFNPLQGTQFPGFGILSLHRAAVAGNLSRHSHTHARNGLVSFHHCFFCPVLYSAAGQGAAAAGLLLVFVLRRPVKILFVWARQA